MINVVFLKDFQKYNIKKSKTKYFISYLPTKMHKTNTILVIPIPSTTSNNLEEKPESRKAKKKNAKFGGVISIFFFLYPITGYIRISGYRKSHFPSIRTSGYCTTLILVNQLPKLDREPIYSGSHSPAKHRVKCWFYE